ncbi:MAG: zinc ribbon domain-containing protein [Ktedonobacterales bacterium]
MILCQNCLHEHPDGTAYCDTCGESLAVRVRLPRMTGRPPTQEEAANRSSVTPIAIISGDLQPPVALPRPILPLDQPGGSAGAAGAPFSAALEPLRLRLNSGKAFELHGKTAYLIGRRDEENGIYPDIDMTEFGGIEGGVSRAHAAIHVRPEGYFVEDLASTNETLLNFHRLLPRQVYPLKDGDQLRFAAIAALVIIG